MVYFLRRRRFAMLRLALLLAACSILGHWYFPYSPKYPKYTVATGLQQHPHGKAGNIIYIDRVANDGKSVRLTDMWVLGFMRSSDSIEWDVVNNQRAEAPADDPDWQELRNLAGNAFELHDRSYWEPFLHRWQEKRRMDEQADGGNNAPQDPDERSALFPMGSSLSGDGLFFAHGYGVPLEDIPKGKGYDVIIEDVASGRQIATVRDQQYVSVAPGGRIAAKLKVSDQEGNGEELFTVWDLVSCQPIVQEKSPRTIGSGFLFSRDGRYVFLGCERDSSDAPDTVTWWDDRGQRIGTAVHACTLLLLDSDRTVATFSNGTFANSPGPARPRLVQFWDVKSGALLGTWLAEIDKAWFIDGLSSASRDERYVAVSASHHPETTSFDPHALLQLRLPLKWQIDEYETEERTILLDARRQRSLIDVPGRSGVVSANGRWFATIDDDSVIRVWELPLSKPWRPILLFAVVATLTFEVIFRFMRRLVRLAQPV